MLTDSEIIDKIIFLLLSNGSLNFNQIVREVAAQRVRTQECLELLVKERLVVKKREGKQEFLFKLNKDTLNLLELYQKKANFTKKMSLEMQNDATAMCKEIDREQSKKKLLSNKKRNKLFKKNLQNIALILDGMKITSILLAAHPFTKTIEKNLNHYQIIRQLTLKKIFTMFNKEKISLGILIKPGLYESIHPISIRK